MAFDDVTTVFVQSIFLFNSVDGFFWDYSFSRLAAYSRAPVSAAYNMFSPVSIFVHKNFPISFLKLRIAGQSVVRYSFSSVIYYSYTKNWHNSNAKFSCKSSSLRHQTEVHFHPAKPITCARLSQYEIRQWDTANLCTQ